MWICGSIAFLLLALAGCATTSFQVHLDGAVGFVDHSLGPQGRGIASLPSPSR